MGASSFLLWGFLAGKSPKPLASWRATLYTKNEPKYRGQFPGADGKKSKGHGLLSYGYPYDKHCFVPRRKGPAPSSMAREVSGISR